MIQLGNKYILIKRGECIETARGLIHDDHICDVVCGCKVWDKEAQFNTINLNLEKASHLGLFVWTFVSHMSVHKYTSQAI